MVARSGARVKVGDLVASVRYDDGLTQVPLAPTADGREFIREALQILRIAQATDAAHEE